MCSEEQKIIMCNNRFLKASRELSVNFKRSGRRAVEKETSKEKEGV